MIDLLGKLRDKKTKEAERKRARTITKSLLSKEEFLVLETMVDLWNANAADYTQSAIVQKLCNNKDYPFEKLPQHIARLRSRGFVCNREEHLLPTADGAYLYLQAHPEQLIRAFCELPDLKRNYWYYHH